jgi:hypothetical protein
MMGSAGTENTRLKQLVAELTLDKTMLQNEARGRAQKKVMKPNRRRPIAAYLEQSYRATRE